MMEFDGNFCSMPVAYVHQLVDGPLGGQAIALDGEPPARLYLPSIRPRRAMSFDTGRGPTVLRFEPVLYHYRLETFNGVAVGYFFNGYSIEEAGT